MARRAMAMGALLGVGMASEVVHSNLEDYNAPAFDTTDVSFSFLFKCQANQDCWHSNTGGTYREANNVMGNVQAVMKGEATYSGFNRDYFRQSLTSAISWASAEYSSAFGINHFSGIKLDRVVEQTGALSSEFTPYNGHWNVMVRVTVSDVPSALANDFMPVITRMFGSNVGTLGTSPGYSPDKAAMHWDSVWISSPTYSYFLDDKLEPVVGRGHKGQRLLIPLLLGITAMLLVPMMFVACTVSQQEAVLAAEKTFNKEDAKYERVARDVAEKEAVVNQHQKAEKEDRDADKKRAQEAADRHAQELEMVDVDWLREAQPAAKPKAAPPPAPAPAAPQRGVGKAKCGLKLEDMTPDGAEDTHEHANGLVVHTVSPGSAAQAAGMEVGDIVLSATNVTALEFGAPGNHEVQIDDQDHFKEFVGGARPGDKAILKITRSGEPMTLEMIFQGS